MGCACFFLLAEWLGDWLVGVIYSLQPPGYHDVVGRCCCCILDDAWWGRSRVADGKACCRCRGYYYNTPRIANSRFLAETQQTRGVCFDEQGLDSSTACLSNFFN